MFTAESQAKLRKEFEGSIGQAGAGAIRTGVGGSKDMVFEARLASLAPGVVAVESIVVLHEGEAWSERLARAAVVIVCPEPASVESHGKVMALCGATLTH